MNCNFILGKNSNKLFMGAYFTICPNTNNATKVHVHFIVYSPKTIYRIFAEFEFFFYISSVDYF